MFHLVGSRFYGTHREDSDYDFIAEDNEENRRTCVSLGLRRLDSPYVRYVGHGLDVCLLKNVEKYVQARDLLSQVPNVRKLSKYERHSKLKEIINGMV